MIHLLSFNAHNFKIQYTMCMYTYLNEFHIIQTIFPFILGLNMCFCYPSILEHIKNIDSSLAK